MLLNYQILTFQNRGSKISFYQTIRSKAQISGCRKHVHCPLWRQPAVPQISRDSRSYCEVTKERRLLFVGGFNSDKEMYLDELSQTVPFLLTWVFTISKIKDQKYLHHNQSLCSDFSLCHSSEHWGWHSVWVFADLGAQLIWKAMILFSEGN